MPPPIQGTLFEQNYLVRTLGSIATVPDVALTELVANAWDAGARRVDVSIPAEKGQPLVVRDDGVGLTPQQFRERWMTLGYDRLRHQGDHAEFPPDRPGLTRRAYGRNGVGRHGLLCFGDTYDVETAREGAGARFTVGTTSGDEPFIIKSETLFESHDHGTTLTVVVTRHLPDADRIRDVLSARFLHDPHFEVAVNGRSVPLEEVSGLIDQATLRVEENVSATAYFVDTTKSARTTKQQGIAFWVGGRLVGSPSWLLGTKSLLDGRTVPAKRYTVIVTSDDLFDDVQADWSGFKPTARVMKLFARVEDYVHTVLRRVSRERAEETKDTLLRDYQDDLRDLPPLAQLEVAEFVEEIAGSAYEMPPETISIAVRAVINLERSKSGTALLEKLSHLSEADVGALDRLLSEWSIRDALTVLDEIDRRIAVVEALAKLSSDRTVDELKTLHPLVTQARWLIGPEFESAEYASNVSLRTAVEKVFGDRLETTAFENYLRRPDLLLLADATLGAVAVDEIDAPTGLSRTRDVLLIELKRGGFEINRKEMNQASSYVEELLGCGLLEGDYQIRAFVVGHACKDVQVRKIGDPERAQIRPATYGQLVRTAEQRLFRLKAHLKDRYDEVSGMELLAKLHRDHQTKLHVQEPEA